MNFFRNILTYFLEAVCRQVYDQGEQCSTADQQIRWYYEPTTDSCQMFTYFGCAGNSNNFKSEDGCQTFCYDQQRLIDMHKPGNQ